MLNSGQNHEFFVPCDLEIWWETLENNRAPFLYHVKLGASFESHRWIQTGVTVQKHLILVKIIDFLCHVTLKFNGWPWKSIGHLFYTTSSFVHHFKAISEFKLELQSGNAQFGSKSTIFLSCVLQSRGFDLCDLYLWPLTLAFYMDITFVIGNNSWKFADDTMMGT